MSSGVVRNKKAYLQGAYFLCSLFSDGWGKEWARGGGGGGGRQEWVPRCQQWEAGQGRGKADTEMLD